MSKVKCDNCDWIGDEDDLSPIEKARDFFARVSPGEQMPAGECPKCGCFAHPYVPKKRAKKTIVHVNQFHIKHNMKNPGERKPVMTCRTYNEHMIGDTVLIKDPETGKELGRFIYSPDKPLACGARVWFETTNQVVAQ